MGWSGDTKPNVTRTGSATLGDFATGFSELELHFTWFMLLYLWILDWCGIFR